MADKPKNQHWVPRFYLKQFAIPGTINKKHPQIWVWDNSTEEAFKTGIKNVASSTYLYSPKSPEGIRDWSTEDRLASFEDTMAKVWPTVSNTMVDFYGWDMLRKSVALFLSLLIIRHPEYFERTKRIHKQFIDHYERYPKDSNGNPIIDEIELNGQRIRLNTSNYEEYKDDSEDNLRRMFVYHINSSATNIAEKLLTKRWSVIVSEKPIFYTSDNPVIIENGGPKPVGILSPGAVINFPICPTKLLVLDDMHDQPKGQYYPLKNDDPTFYNVFLVRNAWKHVLSQQKFDLEKDVIPFITDFDKRKKKWGVFADSSIKLKFMIKRTWGRISKLFQ